MKFKLSNGDIVEAIKDCQCVTHEGPHWLHMDDLHKTKNQQYKENNPRAFIIGEQARLKNKLYEMTSRQITEILR